jgi:repressor of nif and glnA expression
MGKQSAPVEIRAPRLTLEGDQGRSGVATGAMIALVVAEYGSRPVSARDVARVLRQRGMMLTEGHVREALGVLASRGILDSRTMPTVGAPPTTKYVIRGITEPEGETT